MPPPSGRTPPTSASNSKVSRSTKSAFVAISSSSFFWGRAKPSKVTWVPAWEGPGSVESSFGNLTSEIDTARLYTHSIGNRWLTMAFCYNMVQPCIPRFPLALSLLASRCRHSWLADSYFADWPYSPKAHR